MVTCVRPSFSDMLPMAPINPFVVGLSPSVAAAVVASNHNTASVTTMTTNSTPTKPKLAFSIDAIVGAGNGSNSDNGKDSQQHSFLHLPSTHQYHHSQHHNQQTSLKRIQQQQQHQQAALSPLSSSQRSDSPEDYERSQATYCQQPLELRNSFPVIYARPGVVQTTPMTPQRGLIYCRRRSSLDRERSPSHSPLSMRCRSRSPRSPRSPTTPVPIQSPANQTTQHQKIPFNRSRSSTPQKRTPSNTPPLKAAPILVPGLLPGGLIRPLPLQPPPHGPPNTRVTGSNGESTVASMPTTLPATQSPALPPNVMSTNATQSTVAPPPPPPPNPHFLAAQFQMAAALAHHHQQQQQQQQQHHHPHHHPPPHLPPGHPMGIFPPGPHHPHFGGGPHLIRDSYPLYPWLLSRHGRIFPHRFPGFLLQPFRKPKRVRTAFSPTQLLKLEHAFEGNHYVVGAERKQLAQGLSLTETQVKVWFQNRRTKHKRMQQEGGDSDSKSNKGDNDGKHDSSQHSYSDHEDDEPDEHDEEGEIDDEEDEVIDMDDYGSEIDMEEQQRMREQLQQQAGREHAAFLNLQHQQPNFQQQHQQFMQHQMFLQQQQQQQQQKQQQQQQQHQQQKQQQ